MKRWPSARPIQAILALLNEEDKLGERVLPIEVREHFSDADGGLIQVTNITTHTLGVVLWDDAEGRGICFPDDQEDDARSRWRSKIRSAPPRRI